MKGIYCAACPATGGELIQGMVDPGREYLASYCIDLYSRAYFVKKGSKEELECKERGFRVRKKSLMMKDAVLKQFGVKEGVSREYLIYLDSDIPVSKGFGSSTADMGASAGACLSFLGETMTASELSRLASLIEATDSSFYEDTVIFDPLEGRLIETLGFLKGIKVIALEPERFVSTARIREKRDYQKKKKVHISEMKGMFSTLKRAVSQSDREKIGELATRSAFLNQKILYKPLLKQILEITRYFGGYGLNIAHSGTAVFLLCPEEMEEERLLKGFQKEGILSSYPCFRTLAVVKGGLSEEETLWIM